MGTPRCLAFNSDPTRVVQRPGTLLPPPAVAESQIVLVASILLPTGFCLLPATLGKRFGVLVAPGAHADPRFSGF